MRMSLSLLLLHYNINGGYVNMCEGNQHIISYCQNYKILLKTDLLLFCVQRKVKGLDFGRYGFH